MGNGDIAEKYLRHPSNITSVSTTNVMTFIPNLIKNPSCNSQDVCRLTMTSTLAITSFLDGVITKEHGRWSNGSGSSVHLISLSIRHAGIKYCRKLENMSLVCPPKVKSQNKLSWESIQQLWSKNYAVLSCTESNYEYNWRLT
jgi:hypothetical protein